MKVTGFLSGFEQGVSQMQGRWVYPIGKTAILAQVA
jgi:hypothetical protein